MKKLLTISLALGAFGVSAAQSATPREKTQTINIVVKSSQTMVGLEISSGAVTTVLDNVADSNIWRALYVENEHATASIFCSDHPAVATSGALRGKEIKAGKWFSWLIPFNAIWYCISDLSSGGSNSMIGKAW